MRNNYTPKQVDYIPKQRKPSRLCVREKTPPPLVFGSEQNRAQVICKVMLDDLIKESGMSLKELARESGASIATISRVHNNPNYRPRHEIMEKIIGLYCHFKQAATVEAE